MANAEIRGGVAPFKTPANGSRVKAEEWGCGFDQSAGRASLQSHGLRLLASKSERTSSGQTV